MGRDGVDNTSGNLVVRGVPDRLIEDLDLDVADVAGGVNDGCQRGEVDVAITGETP